MAAYGRLHLINGRYGGKAARSAIGRTLPYNIAAIFMLNRYGTAQYQPETRLSIRQSETHFFCK
jgi:hypothetical protein